MIPVEIHCNTVELGKPRASGDDPSNSAIATANNA